MKKLILCIISLIVFALLPVYKEHNVLEIYNHWIINYTKSMPRIINNNEELNSKTLLKYTLFSLLTIFTHYWGLIPAFFQILYLLIFSLIKKGSVKPLFIVAINIFYISGFFKRKEFHFFKK